MRILWNRRIAMRDGIEIAADVVLPSGKGPWPAVVTRTPYMRGRVLRTGFWPQLVDYGYAYIVVDVRGRGDSDGEFLPFTQDPDDGYDVIEWVAAEPWCTGRVGMVGVSYEGLTQWWTAKAKPPHLRCVAPFAVGAASLGPRPNCDTGIPIQYWIWWFNVVTGRTTQHPGSPSWEANYEELPLRDLDQRVGTARRWWPKYLTREIEYLGPAHTLTPKDWSSFEVPALIGLGWWDDQTTIANWLEVKKSPAGADASLLIGAWDHSGNEGPMERLGGLDVSASVTDIIKHVDRFLAPHLKEEEPQARSPRCRVFRTGTMRWEEPDDWPSPAAAPASWHFGADGSLSENATDSGTDSYVYDPSTPVRDFSNLDHFAWSDPPLDSRYLLRRDDVLVFTTDALERRLDVSGHAFFKGFVSVDALDTDIAVTLYDVYPDGRSILLGAPIAPPPMLRLAFRNGPDPEPLTPGQPVEVSVPVAWLHHSFLPGHRIRLAITSSLFPIFARNLNGAEPWPDATRAHVVRVTVHRGHEHPSRLVLPVEQPRTH